MWIGFYHSCGLVFTIHCDGWMGWDRQRFVQTETDLTTTYSNLFDYFYNDHRSCRS